MSVNVLKVFRALIAMKRWIKRQHQAIKKHRLEVATIISAAGKSLSSPCFRLPFHSLQSVALPLLFVWNESGSVNRKRTMRKHANKTNKMHRTSLTFISIITIQLWPWRDPQIAQWHLITPPITWLRTLGIRASTTWQIPSVWTMDACLTPACTEQCQILVITHRHRAPTRVKCCLVPMPINHKKFLRAYSGPKVRSNSTQIQLLWIVLH